MEPTLLLTAVGVNTSTFLAMETGRSCVQSSHTIDGWRTMMPLKWQLCLDPFGANLLTWCGEVKKSRILPGQHGVSRVST